MNNLKEFLKTVSPLMKHYIVGVIVCFLVSYPIFGLVLGFDLKPLCIISLIMGILFPLIMGMAKEAIKASDLLDDLYERLDSLTTKEEADILRGDVEKFWEDHHSFIDHVDKIRISIGATYKYLK